MPLNKQNVPVSFQSGIDTKTDKKQVQGKLLSLQNAIFQTGMEIRKRNGFGMLSALSKGVSIASYHDELVSLDGTSLYSYDESGLTQINKGSLPTTSLDVQSVIRNTTQQTICDSAINGGLKAFSWFDSVGQLGYSIIDTLTGQSVVNNAVLSATGVRAKVVAFQTKFVFFFYDGGNLKYKTVDITTPTVLSSATTVASDVEATKKSFDVSVFNSRIYIAYGTTTANRTSMYYLDSSFALSTKFNVTTTGIPDCIAITPDISFNPWVGYGISGAGGGAYAFIINAALTGAIVSSMTLELPGGLGVRNITAQVSGSVGTFWYECVQTAGPTDLLPNLVRKNTMTSAGVVGTASLFLRGIGLASKAFTYNSVVYFLATFNSELQSSYFLVSQTSQVVAKLSPQNGGGYTTVSLLPEMNVASSTSFQVAALIKDLATSTNGTITTQTGVNAATFTFTTAAPSKFVLGQNLHIAGGLLMMYDGASVVEHGFDVFPEGLTATLDYTGTGFLYAPAIDAVSSAQYEYAATYEWTDNEGQLHLSAPSVPKVIDAFAAIPHSFNGTTKDFTTGTSNQIIGITPSTATMSVGQYVNLLGGNFIPNATIVSIDSSTQITISETNGGALLPGSGDTIKFVVSNQPMGFVSNDIITAGSASITLNAPSSSAFLSPGQRLFWSAGYGGIDPAERPDPFPSGITITEYVNGSHVTVSEPAAFGFDFSGGVFPQLYTFDTLAVNVQVPTLKLTQKQKVVIGLYRTQLDGTVFFRTTASNVLTYNNPLVDSITIADETSDGTLIGFQELYTTGGVVENIGIPSVSVATTFKSRAIAITPEAPLSWWYSKQVLPGLPVEFSDLLVNNIDSRIKAITATFAMDDKLIFWGPTSIFYVVGDGPTASGLNNTFTDAQLISTDVGCANQASIVLTPVGVMFQSDKGIYLLDRSLAVQYIGADVEAFNSLNVTSAQLMNSVNQVRFTLAGGTTLVFDYFYKQWDTFVGFNANDSCLFQKQHTYIQSTGEIGQEVVGQFSDGTSTVIPFYLESNWMSFANIQGFQRVYSLNFLGEWKSAHTLTFNIYTNFNETTPSQTVVVPMLTNPGRYQFQMFLTDQKTESMKITITETQPTAGEGLSISNMSFVVGIKQGQFQLADSMSFS